MKSNVLAITVLLVALGVTSPAQAQTRCWSNGGRLYCTNESNRLSDRYDDPYDNDYDYRYDDHSDRDRNEAYDNINQLYRDVLGRNADWGELRDGSRDLERGRSLGYIRQEIAQSREARERINQLYREVLGRNADSSGLNTYTDRLADGWSLRDVRRDLSRSDEARGTSRDDRDAQRGRGLARSQELRNRINQLYREVLGRDADPIGLETYLERLANGWSLRDVRRDLERSSEARGRGRNDRDSRDNQRSDRGRGFARSQEARDRINQLYREVLGRDADPSGLNTYLKRLADGWSLQDVRRDLERSDEARNRNR